MAKFEHLDTDQRASHLRRYLYSLNEVQREELFFGGHIEEKHTGLSQEDLIKRMYNEKITAASSYPSPEVALEIATQIISKRGNAEMIMHFTDMTSMDSPIYCGHKLDIQTSQKDGETVKKLIIHETEPAPGRKYASIGITSDFRFIGSNSHDMVVVKAPTQDFGFRIITCMGVRDKENSRMLEPHSQTLKKANAILFDPNFRKDNGYQLSLAEKTMWIYRQKGYESRMKGNKISCLFSLKGANGPITFEAVFDPKNPNAQPEVSLTEKTQSGKLRYTPLEDTRFNAQNKEIVMNQALKLKGLVFDRAMRGELKDVAQEHVAKIEKAEQERAKNQNIGNGEIQ